MDYQMLVLDLDGTLTNSRKELTEPTKRTHRDSGRRKESYAHSGRPINGIVPLAEKLNLSKYGGYNALLQWSQDHSVLHRRDASIIVLCLPM